MSGKPRQASAHETYRAFAPYYDAYTAAFDKDLPFYTGLCAPHERIVEVGCGTGRVLRRLLEHGFRITGVDISPEMLATARQQLAEFGQHGQVVFWQHNLLEQPLPAQFDKVLVTWYTMNYILVTPDIFLRNLLNSMTAGALLGMDLFYPKTLKQPALHDAWTTRQLTAPDRVVTLQDKRAMTGDLEERIQIYHADGQTTEIRTLRQYYAPHTVKRLLENVGFTEISFSADYDARTFKPILREDELCDHFVVTAQKP